MNAGDKVVAWAGVDECCQECDKPATWRVRDLTTEQVVFAACADHKPSVRQKMLAAFAHVPGLPGVTIT